MKKGRVLLLACIAAQLHGQSSLPPEVLLLSKIKRQAAADLAHMPNVTCLETIERGGRVAESKPFVVRDVVELEVARVGGRELFSWPGASDFENRPIEQIVGTGLISNGEYISHARAVFSSDTAVIRYSGNEISGGHAAARYDYRIAPMFSGWSVTANEASAIVGTRGSFWADTANYQLLRLTVEGSEIPPELKTRAVRSDIEYGRIPIGAHEFLLPSSASTWIIYNSGAESRNRTNFTHCREYGTESILSPNAEAPTKQDNAGAAPVITEFSLPPDHDVFLRLKTPILANTARVGDAIAAIMDADVKVKGRVIAAKGTIASGRLRVLQRDGRNYIAGLEFTDLSDGNKHALFYARLLEVDPRFALQELRSVRPREVMGDATGSILKVEVPPEIPGVGMFFIPGSASGLPEGTAMKWKTMGFKK